MKYLLPIWIVFSLMPEFMLAQGGALDVTFNLTGYVTTAIGTSDDNANALAIQSDGKILVAGESNNGADYDIALARYNADGSADISFATNGKATYNIDNFYDTGKSILVQQDGKIIVAGYFFSTIGYINKIILLRYNTDGTLDISFANGGVDTFSAGGYSAQVNAAALQSDGKIVMAGTTSSGLNSDFMVIRLNTDGTLDNTFGVNGMVTTSIGNSDDISYCIAIQPDDKIVLAGKSASKMALARYNTDGTLDNTFSSDGKVTFVVNGNDKAFGIALQSDGKIVVCGEALGGNSYDISVARLTTTGGLDNTFSSDGTTTTTLGSSYDGGFGVVVQSNGRIVVAGKTAGNPDDEVALVGYNENGTLDNTFGTSGKVSTDISGNADAGFAIALQSDQNIVVAGISGNGSNSDFLVLRYLSGVSTGIGTLASINPSGSVYPNPLTDFATYDFTLQHEGNVTLQLEDVSGRVLQTYFENEAMACGRHSTQLFLPALPPGTYILRTLTGENAQTVKLIKL